MTQGAADRNDIHASVIAGAARLGAKVAAAGEEDSHSCQSASSAEDAEHDLAACDVNGLGQF